MRQLVIILFFVLLSFNLAFGVDPDEILPDRELEKRAREISSELRCLVCRNENIDSSDAALAKDLRLLVRERLSIGATNSEVIQYVHARYGDFVLLKPRFSGHTIILWLIAPLSFIFGSLLIYRVFFQKKNKNFKDSSDRSLTKKEENTIKKLLED